MTVAGKIASLICILALSAFGVASASDSIIIDFTAAEITETYGLWEAINVPDSSVSDALLIQPRSISSQETGSFGAGTGELINVVEILVDFSLAPPGTHAIVLLPSSISSPNLDIETDSIGLVTNVGVLKSIDVVMWSDTDDIEISVVLTDSDRQQTLYGMGASSERRWRQLAYRNPDYIKDVRMRELRAASYNPPRKSYLQFSGIIIHKPPAQETRRFAVRLKHISLVYDRMYLE